VEGATVADRVQATVSQFAETAQALSQLRTVHSETVARLESKLSGAEGDVANLHAKLGVLEADYAARLAAEATTRAQLERFVRLMPLTRHRVAIHNWAARHAVLDFRCGSEYNEALDELRCTLLDGVAQETSPGDGRKATVHAQAVRLVAAKAALEESLEIAREEHTAIVRNLQAAHNASTAANQQVLARLTDELDIARTDYAKRVAALEATLAAIRTEHAEVVAAHDAAYAAQQEQLRYGAGTTLTGIRPTWY